MKRKTMIEASTALVLGLAVSFAVDSRAAIDSRAAVQEPEEIHCLALNIYHEARGEPELGKLAVGHVVMNRVADPEFPKGICEVVMQGGERRDRCQFSWHCDGRRDRPLDPESWAESTGLARRIYLGLSEDPTQGALWYHADYVAPYWKKSFKRGPKIGQHIFYSRGAPKRVAARFGWVMSVTMVLDNPDAELTTHPLPGRRRPAADR